MNTDPGYTDWPISLKLSGFDKDNRMYKMFISKLYISVLKSGPFSNFYIKATKEETNSFGVAAKPF